MPHSHYHRSSRGCCGGCTSPFAFRPWPVTIITTLVYGALLAVLVLLNESVPGPAKNVRAAVAGGSVDLDRAWNDLARLTAEYHPYNSHANDHVGDWLDRRVAETLTANGCSWDGVYLGTMDDDGEGFRNGSNSGQLAGRKATRRSDCEATAFVDMLSNVTMTTAIGAIGSNMGGAGKLPGTGAVFEGTNRIVYVRGSEDPPGKWWEQVNNGNGSTPDLGRGGTLVNAHYDSVSTGYGATDNGMGVATVLQLIKHFTSPGNQPVHGIVFLLNNCEEDFLWGIRAFGNSQLLPFCKTFLNLEGAGAGGRAMLFRTTDYEVTKAYSFAPQPLGTVVSADGFKLGLIRSETDFSVLRDSYGMRGLDVAFFHPRARYHTDQDDLRHASRNSLAHMLSAAMATTTYLSSDRIGDRFSGGRADHDENKIQNGGGGSQSVLWFDVLGRVFAVASLQPVFAVSVALLVAGPLLLLLLSWAVARADKWYFFATKTKTRDYDDPEFVRLDGWYGASRFPVALVLASGFVVGSALLLHKLNPLIVYSSAYCVWAMMLSLFYSVFFFYVKLRDKTGASALSRGFGNMWLFIISWLVLVGVTVGVDRLGVASGYAGVFFYMAAFVAYLVSVLELLSLDKKHVVAERIRDDNVIRDHLEHIPHGSQAEAIVIRTGGNYDGGSQLIAPSPGELNVGSPHSIHGHASETSPLLRRSSRRSSGGDSSPHRQSFLHFGRQQGRHSARAMDGHNSDDEGRSASVREWRGDPQPYGDEQSWSGPLWTWPWVLQFLVLGPIFIVLLGQVGLLVSTALSQTGVDGSSLRLPYLAIAVFSILLLLPVTPFVHRVHTLVPVVLFFVFAFSLAYCLLAFPFDSEARFKVFWQQTIDCDTGNNTVRLMGLEEYTRHVIDDLPSAMRKTVVCGPPPSTMRAGLTLCEYDGSLAPPRLDPDLPFGVPPETKYGDLVTVTTTKSDAGNNAARITIDAVNTKACAIRFDQPVMNFTVQGAGPWDPRFGPWPEAGVGQIRLWRRDWTTPWVVDLSWEGRPVEVGGGNQSSIDLSEEDNVSGELRERTAPKTTTTTPTVQKLLPLDGRVVCLWADANTPGTIPAFDEAVKYAPKWAAVTKMSDGLVEASKAFAL